MVGSQKSEVGSYRSEISNPNATYEQSSTSSRAAAAASLAYFLRRLSLNLVGIARAAKGDVTPAGEEFCEILRLFATTSSRINSVKSEALLLSFDPRSCNK